MPTELTVQVETLKRPNGKYLVQYLVLKHQGRTWTSLRLMPAQDEGFGSEEEAIAFGYDHVMEDVQSKYPKANVKVKK